MPKDRSKLSKRLLEPMERISEVLFGLIMVLTFTGSLSAAKAGREEVRTMLVGALGCNLAWGIIDGFFYLMARFSERGRDAMTLRAMRKAADPIEVQGIIADALPEVVASVLAPMEFEAMRHKLSQLPEPPRPRLTRSDWLGALGVFLLVFLSTFPATIPFIFTRDARVGLRISNGVAVVMLFFSGYTFGRNVGGRPWRAGLLMVVLGLTLVGITIALGG